ncbi:hypothetical protein, partial [Verrucomicrobium sp. BvORR034]|uniref:hypothetical protein n=1 Tax=Verrucomicrobium sp. BvORR034 TaxID=1396418 RepID=UPI0022410122
TDHDDGLQSFVVHIDNGNHGMMMQRIRAQNHLAAIMEGARRWAATGSTTPLSADLTITAQAR